MKGVSELRSCVRGERKSRILRYPMVSRRSVRVERTESVGLGCIREEEKACVGLGCRRSDAAHAPRLASEMYYSLYPPTPRLRAPQAVVEKSRILRYSLMLRAPQACIK